MIAKPIPVQLATRARTRCPGCWGTDTRAVTAGAQQNLFCRTCGTCWYAADGASPSGETREAREAGEAGEVSYRRVDRRTCPGCSEQAICRAAAN